MIASSCTLVLAESDSLAFSYSQARIGSAEGTVFFSFSFCTSDGGPIINFKYFKMLPTLPTSLSLSVVPDSS